VTCGRSSNSSEAESYYIYHQIIFFLRVTFVLVFKQGRIQGGGGDAPLKLEKIWFFGVKSWFFTRNTPKMFAPPFARRNFFKCAPLSWNPGSVPVKEMAYPMLRFYYTIVRTKRVIRSRNFKTDRQCNRHPITTKVMSSNPAHFEVYSIQHYVIVCQWLATGRWFSPGTLISSTNKADSHDITETVYEYEA
jgi:hypothetical protein